MGGPAPPGAAISASPSSGGGYSYQSQSYGSQQGHYGQYPGQSGQQQQDYSQAWAQYYAQVSYYSLI